MCKALNPRQRHCDNSGSVATRPHMCESSVYLSRSNEYVKQRNTVMMQNRRAITVMMPNAVVNAKTMMVKDHRYNIASNELVSSI